MDFKPDLIDYWSSDAHVIECNKSDTTSKQCTYNLERNARKLTLIDSECNDYLMSLCFIGVVNHKKFMFPNKVAKSIQIWSFPLELRKIDCILIP